MIQFPIIQDKKHPTCPEGHNFRQTGKLKRQIEAKNRKRWRCNRRPRCKAKITSYGVYETVTVWRCHQDSRNKGMSQEKCNYDICVTCMEDFQEKRLEGDIVAMNSDEDQPEICQCFIISYLFPYCLRLNKNGCGLVVRELFIITITLNYDSYKGGRHPCCPSGHVLRMDGKRKRKKESGGWDCDKCGKLGSKAVEAWRLVNNDLYLCENNIGFAVGVASAKLELVWMVHVTMISVGLAWR